VPERWTESAVKAIDTNAHSITKSEVGERIVMQSDERSFLSLSFLLAKKCLDISEWASNGKPRYELKLLRVVVVVVRSKQPPAINFAPPNPDQ
jgi:hypothetical protein